MARPTLPDNALVGDAGHATDHNILRDAAQALYDERTTSTVDPEGTQVGAPGALHVNQITGALFIKSTGTGNTGWVPAKAGSSLHSTLSGLTTGNDHTQYQLKAEEGQPGGYAGLGGDAKVPYQQLPMGTAVNTVAWGDHVHPDLVPIGAVIAYGGSTAPAGWLLCNGATIPVQYSALIALVGSVAPDLRNRFVVGAGSNYGLKATGGADAVQLTAAQSGTEAHNHTASSGTVSAYHQHVVNPAAVTTSSNSHSHVLSIREGTGTGDGTYLDTNPTDAGNGNVTLSSSSAATVAHTHTVDLPTLTTGNDNINHTHTVTVNNSAASDASATHENRPPYYALTYIIRAV